jgi:hypothetical protein
LAQRIPSAEQDQLFFQREDAAYHAINEDLDRFASQRRLAIAQYLEAVGSAQDAAGLHQLRIDFSIHSARDYAERALHFHAILQSLLGISGRDDEQGLED